MREKVVEAAFVNQARYMGIAGLKLNIVSNVGWPDRIFFGRGRIIFFVEFKAPSNKPIKISRRQEYIHGKIREWGFRVYVVDKDGKEQAKRIIGEERAGKTT